MHVPDVMDGGDELESEAITSYRTQGFGRRHCESSVSLIPVEFVVRGLRLLQVKWVIDDEDEDNQ